MPVIPMHVPASELGGREVRKAPAGGAIASARISAAPKRAVLRVMVVMERSSTVPAAGCGRLIEGGAGMIFCSG
jgi:hypothetical protein